MRIFISHSSMNVKIAEKICSIIEKAGHKCFIAPRDNRMGHEYASEIIDGLDNSEAMLLLLSKEAAASPHVLREIERAVSKNIPIIVYKLEEVELTKSLEYYLMTHQWITTPKSDYKDILECIATLGGDEDDGDDDEEVAEYTTAKKPRKRFVLPLVIALSAVLIAVAIMAGSIIIKNAKEGKKNENPTTGNEITSADTGNDEQETTTDNTTDVKIGDRITLGNYNGEDIVWRVLRISEDGKTAVLISQNILTVKAFTAAESGQGGYYEGEMQIGADAPARTDLNIQKIAWGDNTWKNSTLRTWLNSNDEVVKYSGQIPTVKAFADRYNDYSSEPGFLKSFTDEELAAIVDTEVSTKGNALAEGEVIKSTDKVFLLSVEELSWFEDSDIPLYAVPTPAAIEKNEDPTYLETIKEVYKSDTYFWWLRDPVESYASKAYVVSLNVTSIKIDDSYHSCVPGIGVRPAITVDLSKIK